MNLCRETEKKTGSISKNKSNLFNTFLNDSMIENRKKFTNGNIILFDENEYEKFF